MKKIITVFLSISFLGLSFVFAQIPTNGLVGYWHFTGNANDATGNGNNGTVNGASPSADRFGNSNSAYSFDGVDDYIDCGNGSSLQISGDITTCMWVKSNSTAASTPLSKYATAGWENVISTGSVAFGGRAPSTYYTSNPSVATVNNNNWHLIVGQREGTNWKIYVDGVLSNQATGGSGSIISSVNLTIGAESSLNNYYYQGLIDDIRIYNRALTQVEITAIYNENLCYQTITVTDTLIINANLTGYNPVTYSNTLKIYPNPAKDHIYINTDNNSTGYQIKIINTLSQVVYQTTISQSQYFIDLNSWSGNGTYFIQFSDPAGNLIEIKKIIIQ